MKKILGFFFAVLLMVGMTNCGTATTEISEEEYLSHAPFREYEYFAARGYDEEYYGVVAIFSGSMLDTDRANLTITNSLLLKADVIVNGQVYHNVKEFYVYRKFIYLNVYDFEAKSDSNILFARIFSRYYKVPLD